LINPFTSIIETFRYGFTGAGTFSWYQLGYSTLTTLLIVLFGAIIFNRTERTFMDTV
jgi:lipopolysaccharide transport system permease protein